MRLMVGSEGEESGLVWMCLYCDAESTSAPTAAVPTCECRSAAASKGGEQAYRRTVADVPVRFARRSRVENAGRAKRSRRNAA
jgi:hypothetical protein